MPSVEDYFIDTPLRLLCELTPGKTLAGHYQLEVQRRVEVTGFEVAPARIVVVDITPEQGAAILASDAADLAAQVQTAHAQIADMQVQVADKNVELKVSADALAAKSMELQASADALSAAEATLAKAAAAEATLAVVEAPA